VNRVGSADREGPAGHDVSPRTAAAAVGPGIVIVDRDQLRGLLLAGWIAARHDLGEHAVFGSLAEAASSSAGTRPALAVITADGSDGRTSRQIPPGFQPRALVLLADPPHAHPVLPRSGADDTKVEVIDRHGLAARLMEAVDRLVAEAGLATPAVIVQKRLSPRERDVLRLMGLGLQSTTIASTLGMSRLTVETHRKSIARKLGVTGAGLVRRATLHVATEPSPAREGGDPGR